MLLSPAASHFTSRGSGLSDFGVMGVVRDQVGFGVVIDSDAIFLIVTGDMASGLNQYNVQDTRPVGVFDGFGRNLGIFAHELGPFRGWFRDDGIDSDGWIGASRRTLSKVRVRVVGAAHSGIGVPVTGFHDRDDTGWRHGEGLRAKFATPFLAGFHASFLVLFFDLQHFANFFGRLAFFEEDAASIGNHGADLGTLVRGRDPAPTFLQAGLAVGFLALLFAFSSFEALIVASLFADASSFFAFPHEPAALALLSTIGTIAA